MERQIVRYWGRKPVKIAYRYINLYSKPGEIVADTFGGSGVFTYASLELGRRAIYIDLNPFAELVAHSLIEGCDPLAYKQAVKKILSRKAIKVKVDDNEVYLEPRHLFYVKCVCKRNVEAKSVIFTRIYRVKRNNSEELKGIKAKVVQTIQKKGQITHEELCKIFRGVHTKHLSNVLKQLAKLNIIEEKEIPIAAELLEPCKCGRTKITFHDEDIWTIKHPIKPYYWYPKGVLRYKNGKEFIKRRDVLRVSELFTNRSLALLSSIWHDINLLKFDKRTKRCLELTFMVTLARSSKMCRKSGGTWFINSYWIPRNFVVKNPYVVFERAVNQMFRFLKSAKRYNCGSLSNVIKNRVDISFKVADSTKISFPKNSIDYVIIDPPHTDETQFFELSFFYTSWLRKKLDFKNELIINPNQGKDLDIYLRMLRNGIKRIHWALKPYKFFTIILHEGDKSIIDKCVKVISSVGFRIIRKEEVGDYSIYTFQKVVKK